MATPSNELGPLNSSGGATRMKRVSDTPSVYNDLSEIRNDFAQKHAATIHKNFDVV